MENTREILKDQHILVLTGTALIIFGTWGLIKRTMSILFARNYMHSIIPEDVLQDPAGLIRIYAGLLMIKGILFLVQLYIGGSAIRDAHGMKKRQIPYFLVTGALISYKVWNLVHTLLSIEFSHLTELDKIVACGEEIVVIAFAVELLIAAVRLRKYRIIRATG